MNMFLSVTLHATLLLGGHSVGKFAAARTEYSSKPRRKCLWLFSRRIPRTPQVGHQAPVKETFLCRSYNETKRNKRNKFLIGDFRSVDEYGVGEEMARKFLTFEGNNTVLRGVFVSQPDANQGGFSDYYGYSMGSSSGCHVAIYGNDTRLYRDPCLGPPEVLTFDSIGTTPSGDKAVQQRNPNAVVLPCYSSSR